jgi:hypothetical protein
LAPVSEESLDRHRPVTGLPFAYRGNLGTGVCEREQPAYAEMRKAAEHADIGLASSELLTRCALGEASPSRTNADRHQRPLSKRQRRPLAPDPRRHRSGFRAHEANLASGGTVTDSEIADFLRQGGLGPETQELLRLIGSLADYRITPSGNAA